MRNLPAPSLNDRIIFSRIARSKDLKYKIRLYSVRFKVNTRYKDYLTYKDQLETLPKSSIKADHAEALVKCYSSKTKHLTKLREDLLFPDIDDFDECPLCGIGEPSTLDHYLPKEEFPEFSVFSKNLIPICSPCNSNYKGVKWLKKGKRIFIHTYFDIFPDQTFLAAKITVGTKLSLAFSAVTIPAYKDFSELFSRHFEKLKLNERYRRKATSEIARKKKRLERILKKNGSASDVSSALKQEADNLCSEYSKNHWKAALYYALSNSPAFCNGGFRRAISK